MKITALAVCLLVYLSTHFTIMSLMGSVNKAINCFYKKNSVS